MEYFIDRIDAGSIHFQLSAKYFIKFERRIDEFHELIFTMDGVRGGRPLKRFTCTNMRSPIISITFNNHHFEHNSN